MAGGTIEPARAAWRQVDAPMLADGLSWLSLGVGVFRLAAPGRVAASLGVSGKDTFLRTSGLREVGTGVGLLRATDRSPWLWARVAGSAVDLAVLLAWSRDTRRPAALAAAAAAVAGVTALDLLCARSLRDVADGEPAMLRRSITIGLPRETLVELVGRPDTLARLASTVATAHAGVDGSSHWVVRGPGRRSAVWTMGPAEAEGDEVRWTARDGDSPLISAIRASFRPAPADRGSVMSLELTLAPGKLVGLLEGKIGRTLLDTALHRFKSLAETGEIPTTERQPAARQDMR